MRRGREAEEEWEVLVIEWNEETQKVTEKRQTTINGLFQFLILLLLVWSSKRGTSRGSANFSYYEGEEEEAS